MNEKTVANAIKAEYCFILIPFMILTMMKLAKLDFLGILTAPDWSLASCIIIGQTQSKIIFAAISSRYITDKSYLSLYVAKRIGLMFFSLVMYFLIQSDPGLVLGIFQILFFIFSSFLYFSDGRAAKLIES